VPLRPLSNALLSADNTTDLSLLRQQNITLTPGQAGAPVFPAILPAPVPSVTLYNLTTMQADLQNEEGVNSLAASVAEHCEQLHILVNNSGRSWGAPLERFRRKMGRDHEARLEIVEVPQDLEAELDVGFAVEASGWKGRSKTAILSAPETEQFYRGVAHVLHDHLLVDRLRHVVDRQRSDRGCRERLHLHTGLRGRLGTGLDGDAGVLDLQRDVQAGERQGMA